jgi:uncharacterized secreted protein with C-terminal beta-propeller domain
MKKTFWTQRSSRRSRRHWAFFESLEPRQLLSYSPIWTINGDRDPAQPNDAITVAFNAATNNFDLTINGTLVASRPAKQVRKIVVNGGQGDDTITVDTGGLKIRAILNGGNGNDVLTGGDGNDTLNGGPGNDVLNGANGNDTLNGGAGNDRLYGGAGNDRLNGHAGDDALNGGDGNDVLCAGDGFDTLNGDAGNDRLYGGRGDDSLNGGSGNDLLVGGAGNDVLNGSDGNDRLFGDTGNDILIGGAGSDRLWSGSGQNTLYAGQLDRFHKDRHDSLIPYDQPADVPPTAVPVVTQDPSHPAPQIASELRQRLIEEAVARYQSLFGTTYTQYPFSLWSPIVFTNDGLSRVLAMAGVDSVGNVTAIDYSDTNTQVAGVDEADLVETDGSFIYRLNGYQLSIIDVRDPATARVVATMDFSGTQVGPSYYYGSPVGMYLAGNRLVVLTRSWPRYSTFQAGVLGNLALQSGLICTTTPQKTTAWVLDVSDPSQPALIDKTNFSGSLASSRVIGDQLYLVLSNSLALPAPQAFPVTDTSSGTTSTDSSAILVGYPSEPVTYRYQSETEYRAWLEANIDQYIPQFDTTLPDGTAGPSGSLIDTLVNDSGVPLSIMTTIVDLNISDPTAGPAAITSAVGSPQTVYASTDNLYVFTSRSTNINGQVGLVNNTTDILKFHLAPGAVTFAAAGHVDGRLLNSYSLDEFNGRLRVVAENQRSTDTTVDRGTFTETWPTLITTHSLYVLSDDGAGNLNVTGELDNIGDNESLRSVLFVQDRAFVVTFRSVDPLFAIDLSDPANPVNRGELTMPGFSTYLYPLDRDHLIGVGQGPSTTDSANFHTVQVSLYDVADLTHPTLLDQKLYDSGYTYSDALYDPHAFSYFPESGVLAIPLNSWGFCGGQDTLAVLQVNPDAGFTELGAVSHDSNVQRSLRIGDNLYSIAANDMKIVNLLHPTQVIADVRLAPNFPQIDISRIQVIQPVLLNTAIADLQVAEVGIS